MRRHAMIEWSGRKSCSGGGLHQLDDACVLVVELDVEYPAQIRPIEQPELQGADARGSPYDELEIALLAGDGRYVPFEMDPLAVVDAQRSRQANRDARSAFGALPETLLRPGPQARKSPKIRRSSSSASPKDRHRVPMTVVMNAGWWRKNTIHASRWRYFPWLSSKPFSAP